MAKNARKAVSKKLRFEVFKRDGFTCQYCGAHPPSAILHVDHIVPVAGGGGNESGNLITACEGCNLGKGARPLNTTRIGGVFDAARALEMEEQAKGYAKAMAARRSRVEQEAKQVCLVYANHFDLGLKIDLGYFASVQNFVEKLGEHDCIRAMESAVNKRPYSQEQAFRYFCGICWNKIREASNA